MGISQPLFSSSLAEGHFLSVIPVVYRTKTLVVYLCKDNTRVPTDYPPGNISSILTYSNVKDTAWKDHIPHKVVLLVSRRQDMVVAPSQVYCSLCIAQLAVGLMFVLLPLLVNILKHYNIALSQLNPNAIHVVVAIEVHYRSLGVVTSLHLFRSYFFLKTNRVWGDSTSPPSPEKGEGRSSQ